MSYRLLYQDQSFLVLDKPAGLLSVPGRGEDKQDCLASRVQADFPDALVVHRLDMATSGLLLMARGIEMQRRLSYLFQTRRVEKRYLARVHGALESVQGEINLPISADWPNRPLQKVDLLAGKPALTRYQVLAYDAASGTSSLALFPVTGRTHQLRLHLWAIGHAILGDALYPHDGATWPPDTPPRMLLHAAFLAFPHPATAISVEFYSACPF